MSTESAAWTRMHCAICGERVDAAAGGALLTVRSPTGRTSAVVAHSECVLPLLHARAREAIEAGPFVPLDEE